VAAVEEARDEATGMAEESAGDLSEAYLEALDQQVSFLLETHREVQSQTLEFVEEAEGQLEALGEDAEAEIQDHVERLREQVERLREQAH
jgi:predicted RecB family endonuclease